MAHVELGALSGSRIRSRENRGRRVTTIHPAVVDCREETAVPLLTPSTNRGRGICSCRPGPNRRNLGGRPGRGLGEDPGHPASLGGIETTMRSAWWARSPRTQRDTAVLRLLGIEP